jgi:hypothetical protein
MEYPIAVVSQERREGLLPWVTLLLDVGQCLIL